MNLLLTSHIGGSYKENGIRIPCALTGANNFLKLLNGFWTVNSQCLIISSDPDNGEINDSLRSVFTEAFKISDIPLSKLDICDRRNENELSDILYDYDILLLAGGHVPTQNSFFKRLHLKELLKNYKGLVIGMSAGSMNCSEVVYAQPELEGEAIDPTYQRYLEGLGLTKISILPHFQRIEYEVVDGLRVLEDISLPDSKIRPFYALVDDSYIFIDDNGATLYGEGYLIEGGKLTKICEVDQCISLT